MAPKSMLRLLRVSTYRYAKRGGKWREYYAEQAKRGKVGGKNGTKGKYWASEGKGEGGSSGSGPTANAWDDL